MRVEGVKTVQSLELQNEPYILDDGVADLTVVVATFNGALYVEEQLRSILDQTVKPACIIVTGDGSHDDTVRRATDMLEKGSVDFLVMTIAIGTGYSDNFFRGASRAGTKLIAFCDQDDIWVPEKVKSCVEVLGRTQAVLCAHGATLVDSAGGAIGRFQQGNRNEKLHPPNTLAPWFTFAGFTMVFRTDLLRLVDPFKRGRDFYRYDESLSHDSWISFLASTFGDTVQIPEPLVRYRQHENNLIGARQGTLRERLASLLGPAAQASLNRSAIARRWAAFLRGIADQLPTDQTRVLALVAAKRWMRISAFELCRLQLYSRKALYRRLASFALLIVTGCYCKKSNGLGVLYMPKDLLLGVLRLR